MPRLFEVLASSKSSSGRSFVESGGPVEVDVVVAAVAAVVSAAEGLLAEE